MCATDWDRWRQDLKKAGLPLPPKPRRREPETASIYALLDPGTRKPRYVGHSGDPARRLREHWRRRDYAPYTEDNPKFSAWLCSLDGPPELHVFQVVPYEERFRAEHYYTSLLRQIPGIDLFNIFIGSEVPAETRAKMGAGHRGIRPSAEVRAKKSAAAKKHYEATGPEACSFWGKKHSPETLAKMSIAQQARYQRERAAANVPTLFAYDPDDTEAPGGR